MKLIKIYENFKSEIKFLDVIGRNVLFSFLPTGEVWHELATNYEENIKKKLQDKYENLYFIRVVNNIVLQIEDEMSKIVPDDKSTVYEIIRYDNSFSQYDFIILNKDNILEKKEVDKGLLKPIYDYELNKVVEGASHDELLTYYNMLYNKSTENLINLKLKINASIELGIRNSTIEKELDAEMLNNSELGMKLALLESSHEDGE